MTWHIKHFNELNTKELYQILKERTDIFVVEQNCPYPEVDGRDVDCYHLFKLENEQIAAYARLLPPGIAYAQASIGRVIVPSIHRGKGYAGELFTRAVDFIQQELHEMEIKIQAQEYLCRFYGAYGFKPISDSYLEDGIPHVDMLLKERRVQQQV
ncbi:GNAT family N-acetyltransferase [Paenibacillus shenyangensis]|uniref:GNAT family N-acetyltransferase n=1 Tax=Paenibacillus sp. A9 TaxID=1284352 RepID=UPI00037C33DC|nr:GNAT family N-acetyltransferase [Paenibacillus sp. A9]